MRLGVQRFVFLTGLACLLCGLVWYTHVTIYDIINSQPRVIQETITTTTEMNFKDFDNVTGLDEYIVPNIVHFIRFQKANFSFVDAVIVLAAFKNQRPDKIMFHADDVNFHGQYWEKVKNTPGIVYEIVPTEVPKTIFGQNFSDGWLLYHAGDVTRIRVLMKYGGIFLDNDSYLVRTVDRFRVYEMAIGWDENQCIGSQVIVANKDARFLRLWLDTYRVYHSDRWYYNAGCKPTEEVLYRKPELVHRVKLLFGVHMLVHNLYKSYWEDWRKQYAIHLLVNHRSYLDKEHLDKWPEFTAENIRDHNYTFGTMAREIYGI